MPMLKDPTPPSLLNVGAAAVGWGAPKTGRAADPMKGLLLGGGNGLEGAAVGGWPLPKLRPPEPKGLEEGGPDAKGLAEGTEDGANEGAEAPGATEENGLEEKEAKGLGMGAEAAANGFDDVGAGAVEKGLEDAGWGTGRGEPKGAEDEEEKGGGAEVGGKLKGRAREVVAPPKAGAVEAAPKAGRLLNVVPLLPGAAPAELNAGAAPKAGALEPKAGVLEEPQLPLPD